MNWRTLLLRSLRFHWRSHLGVVLGAAVGSAALIGALVVGDSVKLSLRERALERLGEVHAAMSSTDRFFLDDLESVLDQSLCQGWWNTNELRFTAFGTAPATALLLRGTATRQDGEARANDVSLIAFAKVEDSDNNAGRRPFHRLRHAGSPSDVKQGEMLLNEPLAVQLHAAIGDELIIRVPKLTRMSRDAAIAPHAGDSVALKLRVAGILPAKRWGDFGLRPGSPPLNAFVNLDQLQRAVGLEHRINLLLYGSAIFAKPTVLGRMWDGWPAFVWVRFTSLLGASGDSPGDELAQRLNNELTTAFRLEDAEALLKSEPNIGQLALTTPRVFLDPPIVRAALTADTNAQPILTLLANLLYTGTNATPYSMVTAAGAPWTPAGLRDDEIVVNQWLAEDLKVKPGDEITMSYFLPESGVKLAEATNTFRIHSIVPMEMPWADRTLMPDFPGIEKAESTSEWDAGFPLTYKVREKDDAYWKKFRGTPKAFITLAAGQKMWGNRFGNLTAIRFPIPIPQSGTTTALTPTLSPGERENHSPSQSKPKTADSPTALGKSEDAQRLSPLHGEPQFAERTFPMGQPTGGGLGKPLGQGEDGRPTNFVENYRAALEKKILANLKPEELGLRFEPVREQALQAAEQSQDFGGLFLGFSFFLILAALLLMAMLFQLGLEQRAPEIGTLLALGFTPKQVRSLLLREGVALSFLGGVIGALGGLAYAQAMLRGLTTIWRDAVGASALGFHFTALTLVIGLFASVAVSAVTIWLTLRKFVRRPARELLAGEIQAEESKVQSLKSEIIGTGALVVALALVGWSVMKGDTANAGAFFGAGALALVAGLRFTSGWLVRLGGAPNSGSARIGNDPQRADLEIGAPFTRVSLAVRGCARRRKRSLATVAMLACGSFLIVSIGVFRLDANRDATQRTSGTGGFALIGETTMPVVHDLNTPSGREFFALNERDLEGVTFVPFRVREGDEASCLNLNRAQKPRLLGLKPGMLEGRFTFAKGDGWKTLISTRLQPGESASHESGNRLNGFPQRAESNTGLKPGANEIEIPAIGDANSIQWAMHKKVGDTIDYVDERGQPFKVRIVGAVANSILQGQLIIDEAEFVKRFPGESGYRMFLIDAPSNAVSQVSATLSRALQDVGLELTPAAQRLAQFNAVQNTYLGTFQVLGGLGLLLGSVGLGIVVLRNVLERRGELAVLLAVGFRKPQLQRLLLLENGALLALGLALGVVAAAVAVLPALLSPSGQLPFASLTVTLGAVLVNGTLWTWAATRLALRGNLLSALRNE